MTLFNVKVATVQLIDAPTMGEAKDRAINKVQAAVKEFADVYGEPDAFESEPIS